MPPVAAHINIDFSLSLSPSHSPYRTADLAFLELTTRYYERIISLPACVSISMAIITLTFTRNRYVSRNRSILLTVLTTGSLVGDGRTDGFRGVMYKGSGKEWPRDGKLLQRYRCIQEVAAGDGA